MNYVVCQCMSASAVSMTRIVVSFSLLSLQTHNFSPSFQIANLHLFSENSPWILLPCLSWVKKEPVALSIAKRRNKQKWRGQSSGTPTSSWAKKEPVVPSIAKRRKVGGGVCYSNSLVTIINLALKRKVKVSAFALK